MSQSRFTGGKTRDVVLGPRKRSNFRESAREKTNTGCPAGASKNPLVMVAADIIISGDEFSKQKSAAIQGLTKKVE